MKQFKQSGGVLVHKGQGASLSWTTMITHHSDSTASRTIILHICDDSINAEEEIWCLQVHIFSRDVHAKPHSAYITNGMTEEEETKNVWRIL